MNVYKKQNKLVPDQVSKDYEAAAEELEKLKRKKFKTDFVKIKGKGKTRARARPPQRRLLMDVTFKAEEEERAGLRASDVDPLGPQSRNVSMNMMISNQLFELAV